MDIFFFLWKIRIIPRGIKEDASKKKTSSDILLFLDNRLFRRYYKLAGSPLTSYSVSYQVKSFYKDRFRHFFRIFSKTIKKENRETKELAIIWKVRWDKGWKEERKGRKKKAFFPSPLFSRCLTTRRPNTLTSIVYVNSSEIFMPNLRSNLFFFSFFSQESKSRSKRGWRARFKLSRHVRRYLFTLPGRT